MMGRVVTACDFLSLVEMTDPARLYVVTDHPVPTPSQMTVYLKDMVASRMHVRVEDDRPQVDPALIRSGVTRFRADECRDLLCA